MGPYSIDASIEIDFPKYNFTRVTNGSVGVDVSAGGRRRLMVTRLLGDLWVVWGSPLVYPLFFYDLQSREHL